MVTGANKGAEHLQMHYENKVRFRINEYSVTIHSALDGFSFGVEKNYSSINSFCKVLRAAKTQFSHIPLSIHHVFSTRPHDLLVWVKNFWTQSEGGSISPGQNRV